jgi:hypothetical protein
LFPANALNSRLLYDKKGQLDELQSELKSLPEPVKFPANIDLVVKNYDKLNAAMPPVQ